MAAHHPDFFGKLVIAPMTTVERAAIQQPPFSVLTLTIAALQNEMAALNDPSRPDHVPACRRILSLNYGVVASL